MNADDEYEHLLTPAFSLLPNGLTAGAPSYEDLSPAELEAFLSEMEPELRRADRDMREITALDQRGVTGAGKLLGVLKNQSVLSWKSLCSHITSPIRARESTSTASIADQCTCGRFRGV